MTQGEANAEAPGMSQPGSPHDAHGVSASSDTTTGTAAFQVRALLFVIRESDDLHPGPVPLVEERWCFPIDAEPLLSGSLAHSSPQWVSRFVLGCLGHRGGWVHAIADSNVCPLALDHPEAVSRWRSTRRFDDFYVWLDARDALAWLVEHRPDVVVEALLAHAERARLSLEDFGAAAVAEVFKVALPGPADFACPWREGGSWTNPRPDEHPARSAHWQQRARRMPAWFAPETRGSRPGPLGGVYVPQAALQHLWTVARVRHQRTLGRPTRPVPPLWTSGHCPYGTPR